MLWRRRVVEVANDACLSSVTNLLIARTNARQTALSAVPHATGFLYG